MDHYFQVINGEYYYCHRQGDENVIECFRSFYELERFVDDPNAHWIEVNDSNWHIFFEGGIFE